MGDPIINLFAPELAPFTVALIVMLAIGAVEAISLLAGFSPSASIDAALPDFELDGLDIEVDSPGVDGGSALGPLSHMLGWLSVGRMPVLVLLVIFLTSFALAGFAVQAVAAQALGVPLHAGFASIPALAAGALATRHVGLWLGRLFPKDHSEAASQKELVGSFATIIRGEASRGAPAEAKASDLRGRTHYLLIEPDAEGEVFAAGQRVFIVGQRGSVYRAVTKVTNT